MNARDPAADGQSGPVSPLADQRTRAARVDDLIARIVAGTYRVPAEDVAAAMLPELALKFTQRDVDNHGEWSHSGTDDPGGARTDETDDPE